MNPGHTARSRLSAGAFHLLLALAALVLVLGSTWLVALWADRELRADLLQQARMVAMAVNPQQVAALNGTAADLASPYYQMIKKQLTAVRLSNPSCRFLYLMSRKPDSRIIIHVDSEPVNSKDYSPPGQTYDEAPGELHDVFATGRGAVKGPYNDRWGTWVSAFVPMPSPVNGGRQTVFGMDIGAADWKWKVALLAALPVALVTIAVMFGLIATLLYKSRRDIAAHREALRESEKGYRELNNKLQYAYLWMREKKDETEARKYIESIIFLTADDGRLCGFTEEAARITKKNHSDLLGCNIQDILVFQEGQTFMDLIHKARPRISHLTTIRFKNQMEDGPVYDAKLTHIFVESKRLFYIVLYKRYSQIPGIPNSIIAE